MATQQLAEGVRVVRAAFAAMYSPAANNHIVKHNEAIIQQFKTSLQPASAVVAARELMLPILQDRPVQDYEVLFGLQLINEHILQKPPWRGHSEEIRKGLRQMSVELVTHSSPARYKNMVLEKVAHFLVSLAIRDWPELWPEFLPDLLAGSLPPQMVCLVLRLMSEEVYEYSNSIATSRRNVLVENMMEGLPQMLSFTISATDTFVNANDASGLSSAIAVMEAFMSWGSIPKLFEARIPTACINMLQHAQFARSALSALRVLFQRKDINENLYAHPGFRQEVFPSLVNYAATKFKSIQFLSYAPPMGVVPDSAMAYQQYTFVETPPGLDGVDSEAHDYTVKFVTVLAKLGTSSFLPAFTPTKSHDNLEEVEKQTAMAFIDLMLSAVCHPSILLRNAAITFFSNLFSALHRALSRIGGTQAGLKALAVSQKQQKGLAAQFVLIQPCFENAFMRELFSTLVKRYVNVASLALIRWPKDKLMEAYAEEDFAGDSNMLNESWNYFKSRAAQNISLATKLEPMELMSVVLDRLVQLLHKANEISWPQGSAAPSVLPAQNGGTNLQDRGKYPFASRFIVPRDQPHVWGFGTFDASHSKVMEAALDGTVLTTEAVLALLTSINYYEKDPSSSNAIEMLFKTILNLEQRNLQAAKVLSLRMFIPLYKASPDALKACLMCLVQIIEKTKQSTLCFRATTSLSSISRRLRRSKSDALHQFLEPLRDFAIRVQVDRDYAPAERSLVLDAAVAVALSTADIVQQAATLEALFNPLMSIMTTSGLTDCIGNPQSLFSFLESAPEREMALACLSSMESAVAQVVRNNRARRGQEAIRTALTQSIAPQVVTFGSMLVTSLHAMYDQSLFPRTDAKRASVLEPTSREVAYLLNLNDSTTSFLSPIAGSFNEADENSEGDQAKSSLQRADDVLKRFGIQVPNPEFSKEREHLKRMRISAYELLRGAILSGVSQSPAHLQKLLEAVCAHKEHVEPVHVQYMLGRVVKSLLSFQVTQVHCEFLTLVNNSQIPEFLHLVRKMVEQVSSGGVDPGSNLFAVQVARDHGRKMVAKGASDLFNAMFPHQDAKPSAYVPQAFSQQRLGASLNALWDALLNPNLAVVDSGSVRSSLVVLCRALEYAPVEAKPLYMGKLTCCLETAFRTDGMGSDSPNDAACGAVHSFFKKWPQESNDVIMGMIAGLADDFKQQISEKLAEVGAALAEVGGNRKSGRSKLRGVIRVLAKKAGMSLRKEVLVQNYFTPLPQVKRSRRPPEEDVQLPEHVVDCLFGGGDPL